MVTQSSEAKQLVKSDEVLLTLKSLVRGRVVSTITRSARIDETETETIEVENQDDFCYGHWMAFIMISGSAVRIMLKLHFKKSTAIGMLSKKARSESREKADRMAMDFMKEQCNLMAGALKGAFNSAKIITGLSIPLVTRGFDEAVFSDKVDKSKNSDVWKIEWPEGSMICSSVIEILDWNQFANFEIADEDEEDEDGEFL